MEHYRRLGFVRRIREAGLPPDYPTDVAYFTRLTKHEFARFELPAAGRADDLVRRMSGSWSAAELPHRCSQMYIERILREEAGRHPTVTLRFGARVLDTVDEGDHVSVTCQQDDAARQARSRRAISSAPTGRAARSGAASGSSFAARSIARAHSSPAACTRSSCARPPSTTSFRGRAPGNTGWSIASAGARWWRSMARAPSST